MRLSLLIALTLIAACGAEPEPPLVATAVVVTKPMPGMRMSAGYLSLTNNTDSAIRITRVLSPQYQSVQLHESIIENGIARMRQIPVLEIPAGETVSLQRGGKHLMLMRPTAPSETVSLELLDGDNLLLTVAATVDPGPRQ